MTIDLKIQYQETSALIEDIVDQFKLHEQLMGPQVRIREFSLL